MGKLAAFWSRILKPTRPAHNNPLPVMELLQPRCLLSGTSGAPPLNVVDPPEVHCSRLFWAEGQEGTTDFSFDVSINFESAETVTVDYATADSTATAGSDYIGASGTLVFAPGETTKTIVVKVFGDTQLEESEYFSIVLSNANGAMIVDDSNGEGAILNDDGDPDAHLDLPEGFESVSEGSGGIDFVVTKTGNPNVELSIDYQTLYYPEAPDYTATPGKDFTPISGTLVLGAGETSKTLHIAVLQDDDVETREHFELRFFDSKTPNWRGKITDIRIVDDDKPSVSLQVDPYLRRDFAGNTFMRFTAKLSSASSLDASFDFFTESGTAIAGTDFDALNSRATIAAGDTSTDIDIPVHLFAQSSPGTDFWLKLANIDGATADAAVSAQARLKVDSAPPTIKPVKLKPPKALSTAFKATLVFSDNFLINASSILPYIMYITGPRRFRSDCFMQLQSNLVDGNSIRVPCRFTAPGGKWDSHDNGRYVLRVGGGQILDAARNSVSSTVVGKFLLRIRQRKQTLL
jgi:hypothetical protein